MSAQLAYSSDVRLEVRVHDKLIDVHCAGCNMRLVVAPAAQEQAALELAARNATARPCCPLWRTDT